MADEKNSEAIEQDTSPEAFAEATRRLAQAKTRTTFILESLKSLGLIGATAVVPGYAGKDLIDRQNADIYKDLLEEGI